MKKLFIFLFSVLLAFACVLNVAGCTMGSDDDTDGSVLPADPHEHSFGEWTVTVPVTCSEAGEEQRTCACGEKETRTVAPLGHNYVDGVCTRCGDRLYPTDDSYFTFTMLEDGTYSVAWDQQTKLPANVVIPQEYAGKAVTVVAKSAFYECADLKSLVIPNGVTEIGDYALNGCGGLESVSIPDSVLSIGGGAFWECESLESITIPDSVTKLGNDAFQYCRKLTSAVNGEGITTVQFFVFSGCESLESVVLPSGVTQIGLCAFENCRSLRSIALPDQLVRIWSGAFAGCSGLANLSFPDSVEMIEQEAFEDCSALESITLGSGVRTIKNTAFRGCSNLGYAVFANPDGWSVAGKGDLPQEALSDPVVAAQYLIDTYMQYDWSRP